MNRLSKDKRKDDPFNPTFREEKDYTRDENKNKIISFVVICFVFAYGARMFVFQNTISIQIKQINGRITTNPMLVNGSMYYFFENLSPWEITLKFACDEWFNSSYNGGILSSDHTVGIIFHSNIVQRLDVTWIKE